VTGRDQASAVLGDLHEDLAERAAAGAAPRWPALWLERQTWRHVMAETDFQAARAGRSGRFVLRDAWRSLRSTPRQSAFIVLILTLGISAATVTFSVVDAVVLRPFPVHAIQELAVVTGRTRLQAASRLSAQEYVALAEGADAFAGLAALRRDRVSVELGGEAVDLWIAQATANLFDVLGRQPAVGRTFGPAHATPGNDAVAVIGDGLWRRLGGDPDVVGITVRVEDRPVRVIGVMPEDFTYPIGTGSATELWMPYVMTEAERLPENAGARRNIDVVGRLRRGASVEVAQSQVASITAALARLRPQSFQDWQPEVTPLRDALLGEARGWMLMMLASVLLVLAVACANVANLLLTRATYRARELSIRMSLGAGRRQLIAVLLVEGLLLSLAAAGVALWLSRWGIDAARAALPSGIVRADAIALDLRVLGAAVAAAVLTGLAFGLAPAWHACRTNVAGLLKQGAGTIVRPARGRAMLLIAEIAFVGILLVATTLFVGSFVRVMRADLGFDRSNLVFIPQVRGFPGTVPELLEALEALPGIDAAAAIGLTPPLVGVGSAASQILSVPDAPDTTVALQIQRVSPRYFDVARIPVLRGRTFPAWDDPAVIPVVIDELAEASLFQGPDAVGRTLRAQGSTRDFIVTGVVANVRVQGPEGPTGPQLYWAIQPDGAGPQFLVRTSTEPAALVPRIRERMAEMLPAGRAPGPIVLDDSFRRLTADRRFSAGLMSIFGVLALVIGAAGIYGVMASLVAQRTREFGVRLALGATAGRIARDVIGQAGRYLGLGLALGLTGAWWVSRGFTSLFYDVQPTDPEVYLGVGTVLGLSGLVAAWLPARRAARVDPVETLRAE
jgi:predicted permease